MFSSDDDNLGLLILLILLILILINVKFVTHWTFYMVYTLAFKYKLMHSFFMILGLGKLKALFIAQFKRKKAENMLNFITESQKSGILSSLVLATKNGNLDSDDLGGVPPQYKTKLPINGKIAKLKKKKFNSEALCNIIK
jgi:hypothetical protein